ncbi:Protein ZINC INDUCED FACILITATOR-LIKE 1 [Mycena kentingensis (nom. inval.)]|nr:Protein ZINC INDUCED FACILITATOR-LIKE 1 [Mycena kentingensis (nom. inval.)]
MPTLKTTPKPLPKLQVTLTILIQATEALSATVIFPFVPQFVQDTGITGGDERKTGYYAGILESIFFLAEFVSVYAWSRASDVAALGRRPVVLLGPLGLAVAMFGFGVAESFLGLVVWRCAQGVFNGNIGVVKTVMAEIADNSNLAQVMSLVPIAWSSGTTIGPIIGGLLSAPSIAQRLRLGLLVRHPYLLPCGTVGVICLAIFLLAFVGLKETSPMALARQRRARDKPATLEPTEETSLLPHSAEARCSALTPLDGNEDRMPNFRELLVPRLLIPLLNYGFFCFCQTAYQVLLPLMYATSIHNGGLGLSPVQIGVIRGVWGILNTLSQLFLIARIITYLGPRKAYIAAFASFVVCFGSFPVMSWVARRAGRVDKYVWAVLVVQSVANLGISMLYASIQMFIVTSSPDPNALSTTNSLAQMVSTIVRGLAPFAASALFAVSLEQAEVAGGQLVYVVMLSVVGMGVYSSLFLPRVLVESAE